MTVRLTVAAARSCELRERFVYSLACCTKREGVCALRFTARWFANVLLAKVERTMEGARRGALLYIRGHLLNS